MTTFCQAFSTNLLFPARWPKEFVWFRYHVIQTISCYSKRNLILKQISQSKQSVKENNAPVMIGSDQACSFSCSPRAICAQKVCITETLSEVFFCVGWMPFLECVCWLWVGGVLPFIMNVWLWMTVALLCSWNLTISVDTICIQNTIF